MPKRKPAEKSVTLEELNNPKTRTKAKEKLLEYFNSIPYNTDGDEGDPNKTVATISQQRKLLKGKATTKAGKAAKRKATAGTQKKQAAVVAPASKTKKGAAAKKTKGAVRARKQSPAAAVGVKNSCNLPTAAQVLAAGKDPKVEARNAKRRKLPPNWPAKRETWPSSLSRVKMALVTAIEAAGLADAPTLTRQQVCAISDAAGIAHPWWLTCHFTEGRGIYTNPTRMLTTENPNLGQKRSTPSKTVAAAVDSNAGVEDSRDTNGGNSVNSNATEDPDQQSLPGEPAATAD